MDYLQRYISVSNKAFFLSQSSNFIGLWSECPNIFSCCCCWVASVMSDSVRPHRRQPTRLPRPWDPPGKSTGVGCHFLLQCMKVQSESEVAQLCPTLCDPIGGSPPGSPVPGILQARALEWVAISFSNAWKWKVKVKSLTFLLQPKFCLCISIQHWLTEVNFGNRSSR